ncbi:hypothetical protein Desor_2121 [Desulfosporosinus orientis DSM 765]|uniref:Uncharacterized protein n=2 Tax=Desulfosporosinus orientis TaxID=1563 RepID=G7W665_DESOD|nr:hypothetical protein Desor_2121 [Desulfosporosinus orientis DSM 765]
MLKYILKCLSLFAETYLMLTRVKLQTENPEGQKEVRVVEIVVKFVSADEFGFGHWREDCRRLDEIYFYL